MKYACELCGYIYDEEAGHPGRGIVAGTVFEQLPKDFECPGCGYEKEAFNPLRKISTKPRYTQSHARPSVRNKGGRL